MPASPSGFLQSGKELVLSVGTLMPRLVGTSEMAKLFKRPHFYNPSKAEQLCKYGVSRYNGYYTTDIEYRWYAAAWLHTLNRYRETGKIILIKPISGLYWNNLKYEVFNREITAGELADYLGYPFAEVASFLLGANRRMLVGVNNAEGLVTINSTDRSYAVQLLRLNHQEKNNEQNKTAA